MHCETVKIRPIFVSLLVVCMYGVMFPVSKPLCASKRKAVKRLIHNSLIC